jgi:hypothetical protein
MSTAADTRLRRGAAIAGVVSGVLPSSAAITSPRCAAA